MITSEIVIRIMVIFAVLVAVFDLYIIAKKGTSASISAVIIRSSYKYPIIPLALGLIVGILIGHLFWQMSDASIWGGEILSK